MMADLPVCKSFTARSIIDFDGAPTAVKIRGLYATYP